MKQIAVRIGGFVVNAGSQTIVLNRNVDVEKSNARSGNFPGKLESRIKVLTNWMNRSSSGRPHEVAPKQSSMYRPKSFGTGPSNWSKIRSST